jgi:signal transduction histidine kinase
VSLWIDRPDLTIAVDPPRDDVEIYADPGQVSLTLFGVLNWLSHTKDGHLALTISCRRDGDEGQMLVEGDFEPDVHQGDLTHQALHELQQGQTPFLYVAHKLVARNGGRMQVTPGRISLSYPIYCWQDVRPLDDLARQVRYHSRQVERLQQDLSDREGPSEPPPLKEVISLGGWAIDELLSAFIDIRQMASKERQSAAGELTPLWESLEAGSHFCQLLAANLLALEGNQADAPYATDVAQVLASVQRILRSKIRGLAELEWDVPSDLPPVRATETSLAQVVMNLALNSVNELARVRPEVSRLGFAARRTPEGVEIAISDTGQGLPQEVAERLSKEMVSTQAHSERGIGLYVVRSILSRWDAEIVFSTREGGGTTACVTLPLWEGGR